jgi:23S rRNA pseudouridine1911/1915/1917 synthase
MASIGCPIKGDVKYGDKRGNKDRSIQLHAAELHFKHPISGQEAHLYAPFPDMPIWKAVPNQNTPETL